MMEGRIADHSFIFGCIEVCIAVERLFCSATFRREYREIVCVMSSLIFVACTLRRVIAFAIEFSITI